MRGFGYSSYKTPITGFDEITNDLHLFMLGILKATKKEKFYIAGQQLGGVIAFKLGALMVKHVIGIINFSMFPVEGLKVEGYNIQTMEAIKSLPEY